jgi:hypothetical protein
MAVFITKYLGKIIEVLPTSISEDGLRCRAKLKDRYWDEPYKQGEWAKTIEDAEGLAQHKIKDEIYKLEVRINKLKKLKVVIKNEA